MQNEAHLPRWWPLVSRAGKTGSEEGRLVERLVARAIPEHEPCLLLDVGCGDGSRMLAAIRRNPLLRATGLIHPGERLPVLATAHDPHERLTCVASTLWRFQAKPVFDRIFLFSWLHQAPESRRKEMLQYCKMLLHPGGLLISGANQFGSASSLCPEAMDNLVRSAGFDKVANSPLTPSRWIITARRPLEFF